MGVARVHGGERKRNAGLDQLLGGGLGDRELADRPAVRLGPSPLGQGGGAVVADFLGHLEMFRRHGPKTADGGQRRRHACAVVLAGEAHRQCDPPAVLPGRVRQALYRLAHALVAAPLRPGDRHRLVARHVCQKRPLRPQPLPQRALQQGRHLLEPVQRLSRLRVLLALHVNLAQLPEKRRAFDLGGSSLEESERLAVAPQERQEVRAGLHRRPEPRLQGQRGLGCGKRLVVPVLLLQHPRMDHVGPGTMPGDFQRPLDPHLRPLEIPQHRSHLRPQPVPRRPHLGRGAGHVPLLLQEEPGIQRARPFQNRQSVIEPDQRILGMLAPGFQPQP